MRKGISIQKEIDEECETPVNIVRYAWGNSKLKTWFITKNKKCFLPKGSKLLFVITSKQTTELLKTSDNYPKIGDVITDIDGLKIKIIDIKWA